MKSRMLSESSSTSPPNQPMTFRPESKTGCNNTNSDPGSDRNTDNYA
jgi:hypothetical protein